jgi:hypothetical protein
VYEFIGAVMTFQGKDFRYVLIGRLAQKNLERNGASKA